MKLFKKKNKKNEKKKSLIIKCGKDDIRTYPRETLLCSRIIREEKQSQ